MAKDPSAHVRKRPTRGILLFLAGLALAGSAFHPATALQQPVYGYAGALVQAASGAGVALVGLAWAAWAGSRPPPPKAAVEAHVAFKRRTVHEDEVQRAAAKPATGIAVPASDKIEVMSDADALALAIKDVQQRMGRAKVMLGTNRLSQEGYVKLMGSLQKELAELEARRMSVEMPR